MNNLEDVTPKSLLLNWNSVFETLIVHLKQFYIGMCTLYHAPYASNQIGKYEVCLGAVKEVLTKLDHRTTTFLIDDFNFSSLFALRAI